MRAKVLVVEDDAIVALSMREVLTLVGFEVVGVAATVSDALCLAQNTQPDIAILDVRLAGRRDGVEGAALLRQRSQLPVVFVTAQGDRFSQERAASVQPAAYLCKPVHAQQLVQAVEEALARNSPSAGE